MNCSELEEKRVLCSSLLCKYFPNILRHQKGEVHEKATKQISEPAAMPLLPTSCCTGSRLTLPVWQKASLGEKELQTGCAD